MQGISVRNFTKGNPGNALPKWIKVGAETRGYGDSKDNLGFFVTRENIDVAFDEAAQGNGQACVMAQAATRLGAHRVYFYRLTAWVDWGEGPLVRYETSKDIYNQIINPFDKGKGNRDEVRPGMYHLLAPKKMALAKVRRDNLRRKEKGRSTASTKRSTNPRPYMGRVVIGSRIDE